MWGVVLETNSRKSLALFFNPKNLGDYITVNINTDDLILEKEKLPTDTQNEILSKIDIIKATAKNAFAPPKIKEYSAVKLIVEDSKYSKFCIHKCDTGCVMDNQAIQDCIEVDFSGINNKGEFCGDRISVNIKDVEIIG